MARPGTVVTIESTNDGGYFITVVRDVFPARSTFVAKDFGHAVDRIYEAFGEDHATPDPKAAEATAKVDALFGPQLKALDKALLAALPKRPAAKAKRKAAKR